MTFPVFPVNRLRFLDGVTDPPAFEAGPLGGFIVEELVAACGCGGRLVLCAEFVRQETWQKHRIELRWTETVRHSGACRRA